jgi:hypothetical protein
MAATFGRLGRHDIGLNIWKCGAWDPDNGTYPCNKPRCCPFCAAVAGYGERRERAARVLLALEANPNLALYYMTLNTHGDQDFGKQVESLRDRMDKLLRRKKGSWSKIRGLIWWIEPARGAGGEWRSHIHAIVAFEQQDLPPNPRCLILRWAHDHRAELPGNWSRDRWESDRKYRDIIEHQDIKPLHCYKQSRLSSRVDATCNPVSRLFDVMNLAEYSRTDGRQKSSEPGKRIVPMTPDDRAHVTLLSLDLRGCKGVFYVVNSDDRKNLEKQLTEIDRSPSRRRQLLIDARRCPSSAHELIPRPRRESSEESTLTAEEENNKSRKLRASQRPRVDATSKVNAAGVTALKARRRPHRNTGSLNTMFRETVRSLSGYGTTHSHRVARRIRDAESGRTF